MILNLPAEYDSELSRRALLDPGRMNDFNERNFKVFFLREGALISVSAIIIRKIKLVRGYFVPKTFVIVNSTTY